MSLKPLKPSKLARRDKPKEAQQPQPSGLQSPQKSQSLVSRVKQR